MGYMAHPQLIESNSELQETRSADLSIPRERMT
jgi:hypothetical protein